MLGQHLGQQATRFGHAFPATVIRTTSPSLDLTDERSGRARPAPPAGDRSRSLSAGTAARSACAVAGTVIAAETRHGAIRKTPPPGLGASSTLNIALNSCASSRLSA